MEMEREMFVVLVFAVDNLLGVEGCGIGSGVG